MNKNTLVLTTSVLVNSFSRLVSTVILTRILAPDAFALVGLLGTLHFVLAMISDAGFRGYIMRHEKGDQEDFLDQLWTIKLCRGVILFLVMIVLAGPLSTLFDIDGLKEGLLLTSITFLIHGISSLYPFVEDRRNRPSLPITLETIASLLAVAITICTTLIYESKWCLVLGILYSPGIQTILGFVFIKQPAPKIKYSRTFLLEFFSWSKFVMLSSVLTILITQADKFILAKLLSPESLGFFYIANNLASIFDSLAIAYSRRLLMPALAKDMHSNNRQTLDHYKFKNKTCIYICVLLGLICGFSGFIVEVIYSPAYQNVAIFLSLLMLRPLLSLLSYSSEGVLILRGKIKTTLYSNIARVFWIALTAFPFFIWFSEYGVVLAFSTSSLLACISLYYFLYKEKSLKLRSETLYISAFLICACLSLVADSYAIEAWNIIAENFTLFDFTTSN